MRLSMHRTVRFRSSVAEDAPPRKSYKLTLNLIQHITDRRRFLEKDRTLMGNFVGLSKLGETG